MEKAHLVVGRLILAQENDCPDCIDREFFRRHPGRHYFVRPAVPGEIESLCKAAGRPNPVEPGAIGFVIGRRIRNSFIRHGFPVDPEDRVELEATAEDEETCRSMFEELFLLWRWADTAKLYDWDREETTIQ